MSCIKSHQFNDNINVELSSRPVIFQQAYVQL